MRNMDNSFNQISINFIIILHLIITKSEITFIL